jgi:hypothetical protein
MKSEISKEKKHKIEQETFTTKMKLEKKQKEVLIKRMK